MPRQLELHAVDVKTLKADDGGCTGTDDSSETERAPLLSLMTKRVLSPLIKSTSPGKQKDEDCRGTKRHLSRSRFADSRPLSMRWAPCALRTQQTRNTGCGSQGHPQVPAVAWEKALVSSVLHPAALPDGGEQAPRKILTSLLPALRPRISSEHCVWKLRE